MLPISTDYPVKGYSPVTWTIIVLCCVIAFIELVAQPSFSDTIFLDYGVHPALAVYDLAPLNADSLAVAWSLVTSMFVHAGIWHVIGNMLFFHCFSMPIDSASDLNVRGYEVLPGNREIVRERFGLEAQIVFALADRALYTGHLMFERDRWAVVYQGWKYILHTSTGQQELYELTSDPRELRDRMGERVIRPAEFVLERLLQPFMLDEAGHQVDLAALQRKDAVGRQAEANDEAEEQTEVEKSEDTESRAFGCLFG